MKTHKYPACADAEFIRYCFTRKLYGFTVGKIVKDTILFEGLATGLTFINKGPT